MDTILREIFDMAEFVQSGKGDELSGVVSLKMLSGPTLQAIGFLEYRKTRQNTQLVRIESACFFENQRNYKRLTRIGSEVKIRPNAKKSGQTDPSLRKNL